MALLSCHSSAWSPPLPPWAPPSSVPLLPLAVDDSNTRLCAIGTQSMKAARDQGRVINRQPPESTELTGNAWVPGLQSPSLASAMRRHAGGWPGAEYPDICVRVEGHKVAAKHCGRRECQQRGVNTRCAHALRPSGKSAAERASGRSSQLIHKSKRVVRMFPGSVMAPIAAAGLM